ncbi:hypothetical protein A7311_24615 [Paenibacillus polymyxa]|uniref:hypothetical protein n=1 Tax=Paenibacillus polymyxa TaxID=1406 RepID=UPI00083D8CE7|nr:hypothetical protein [Paenibacillus polymyxa]ODB52104.1 hypothetical protein A7311_24615 [Paenibacillus polymyxa]
MKRKKIWVTALILFFILIGALYYMHYASNIKKEEAVRTGIPIGKEYIKEYYRADFIFKSYDYIGSYVNNTIYLIGYIKGHEGHSISIAYDFEKKEVLSVTGPDWFIDSRYPKKNVPPF